MLEQTYKFYGTIAEFYTKGFLLYRVVYFQSSNSRNDLFIATIQICNELVFLCLQTYFGVFQTFVKQLGSLISNFNIKQEGSWVLGRSPDMTIRKVRRKKNHYPTLQLSIFDGSAVLIRLCF